ncbi:hypothetical protein QOZ80_3BG0262050 [Eleusine coracana subsp. coracana]|nr:hypothetical protein QOZ80_3BG0262050 [Eleusine coracana subsp. coracana]
MTAVPPIYVSSVEHLRHVLATEAATGEPLRIAVDGNVSFKEARRIWEVVTTTERRCELINIEVLNHKHHASLFIRKLIDDLKEWRTDVDINISTLVEMASTKEAVAAEGGPGIPEGYGPVFLHGPRLYLDVDKAGIVNGEQNRKQIMQLFDYHGPIVPHGECDYWDMGVAAGREIRDGHSFTRINEKFLELKISALVVLRAELTKASGPCSSWTRTGWTLGPEIATCMMDSWTWT